MRFLPLLALLLLPLPLFAQNAPPPAAPPGPGAGVTPAVLTEHVMGDPAAKFTLIEYASLTCPHCAEFANHVLPKIMEKYIASGRMKLVFRDYPLDNLAFKAAMIGQCMPAERYFVFIKTLFANQPAWVGANDPEATLKQYAKLAGLPGERIEACLNDRALQAAIVRRRMEAEEQYKIMGTPSFVANYSKESFTGIATFEDFEKAIAKYMK